MIVRRSVFSRFLRRVTQFDRWSEARPEAAPTSNADASRDEDDEKQDPRPIERIGALHQKLD